MNNRLTLDNNEFHFNESFLPCLVAGVTKSGASYLSICLISNLIQAGSKVIFFTAFPMAKEELLNQIDIKDVYEVNNENDLNNIPQNISILVQSGNKELWQKVIEKVSNLNEYVIFVKNIEEYNESIMETMGECKKLLLSGDITACAYKENVVKIDWCTKILFSITDIGCNVDVPILEKYESYLMGQNQSGVLRLIK